jgi:hypothetical protein
MHLERGFEKKASQSRHTLSPDPSQKWPGSPGRHPPLGRSGASACRAGAERRRADRRQSVWPSSPGRRFSLGQRVSNRSCQDSSRKLNNSHEDKSRTRPTGRGLALNPGTAVHDSARRNPKKRTLLWVDTFPFSNERPFHTVTPIAHQRLGKVGTRHKPFQTLSDPTCPVAFARHPLNSSQTTTGWPETTAAWRQTKVNCSECQPGFDRTKTRGRPPKS